MILVIEPTPGKDGTVVMARQSITQAFSLTTTKKAGPYLTLPVMLEKEK